MTTTKEQHDCQLGDRTYRFRTPTVYDPADMRRILTRKRVRRPSQEEFETAALAGIMDIGAMAGEPAEGERQQELLREWYELIKPIEEDRIDIVDPVERKEEAERLRKEKLDRMIELQADVMAIEANLERHCPAYAELTADRRYWDDVSRIEIVRLLLVSIDGRGLDKDPDGRMLDADILRIPQDHRLALATFAFRLIAPGETQRKN